MNSTPTILLADEPEPVAIPRQSDDAGPPDENLQGPGDAGATPAPSAPPARKRARLSPRRGWFKVWRRDRALIIEHLQDEALSVLSIWDAFCDVSNQKRSSIFDESAGVIRHRAGVSRSTFFRGVAKLVELGMLTRTQNKTTSPTVLDVNTYALHGAAEFNPATQTDGDTASGVKQRAVSRHRGKEKLSASPKKRRKEREAASLASSAQTPDGERPKGEAASRWDNAW